MSKECKDCEYFYGYDSDGCPKCCYDGGYEECPYNETADVKNDGIKIEIDTGFMSEYIRHTLENSAQDMAQSIIEREISSIVTQAYRDSIKKMTEQAIQKEVDKKVSEFMSGDITIGGGWCEPARTIKRDEYMRELVEKALSERLKSSALKEEIKNIVYNAVNAFAKSVKDEANKNAKLYLDEAIKQTLGESVVSILMGSQPYMQLSEKMQNILPEGKG